MKKSTLDIPLIKHWAKPLDDKGCKNIMAIFEQYEKRKLIKKSK